MRRWKLPERTAPLSLALMWNLAACGSGGDGGTAAMDPPSPETMPDRAMEDSAGPPPPAPKDDGPDASDVPPADAGSADAGASGEDDAGDGSPTAPDAAAAPDAAVPSARCEATRTPATTLTGTGCFGASGEPDDTLVPYELNAPLWSDGASKQRWVAVPPGEPVEVGDDGDLHFPQGTVLLKEFRRGEQRLETRLLMRVAEDEWLGVAYAWDEAGMEARLLDDGLLLERVDPPWRVPSPAECFECHTDVAGTTLGPTLGQLDREVTDPESGEPVRQLDSWKALGLLDEQSLPAQWAAMADLADTAEPVEQRARAYLASNCGSCHRSGGPGLGTVDFRIELALEDMGICEQPALGGNMGVEGAQLLVPGEPERSMIWLRPRSAPPWRMPPLGTSVLDEDGSSLIADWIRSLEGCP